MWSANKIIKEENKKKKIRANFTIDEDTYLMFKRTCEKRMIPMSRYIDKQMKNFVGI